MIFQFTPEQLAQLRTAQPTDATMQRRLEALQLLSQGYIEAQLVFSGSTWVKAAPGRNRSEAPLIYAVGAAGCVSSTATQENIPHDP